MEKKSITTKREDKDKVVFEVGQWVFCEFDLKQIKCMYGDTITEVSNGIISTSSTDMSDRCFPMDMKIKHKSENIADISKGFHKLNFNSLNYPDINRYLISRWIEYCDEENDEKAR